MSVKMTVDEIVDMCIKHYCDDAKPRGVSSGGGCVLLNDQGDRCAVGLVLGDSLTDDQLHACVTTIGDIFSDNAYDEELVVRGAIQAYGLPTGFWGDLQDAHDNVDIQKVFDNNLFVRSRYDENNSQHREVLRRRFEHVRAMWSGAVGEDGGRKIPCEF